MAAHALRPARAAVLGVWRRAYSHAPAPRHLLSIADLTAAELSTLVLQASAFKRAVRDGRRPAHLGSPAPLAGRSVAMMFSKRSTRTRVSTEAAVAMLGGHAMFLGKDDIQLGVNESIRDTSTVLSSMTCCMVARVGPHSDVAQLAEHAKVPVLNALSDSFHPLQTLADLLTLHEAFASPALADRGLGLAGPKVAWIGDANNVLFDLAAGCIKLGIDVAVASPAGYGIPEWQRTRITTGNDGAEPQSSLTETTVPEEAIRNADVLVTDTWISMGQESERKRRLDAFAGYQITKELAERGGAKPTWKFMHCLPRHPEEVADDVFYGPRSLVFAEAGNRLWAVLAALDAFVVNKGRILGARKEGAGALQL